MDDGIDRYIAEILDKIAAGTSRPAEVRSGVREEAAITRNNYVLHDGGLGVSTPVRD